MDVRNKWVVAVAVVVEELRMCGETKGGGGARAAEHNEAKTNVRCGEKRRIMDAVLHEGGASAV